MKVKYVENLEDLYREFNSRFGHYAPLKESLLSVEVRLHDSEPNEVSYSSLEADGCLKSRT